MRLSIATKIFVAFTGVIVIFAAVLIFGIYRTQATYGRIQTINRSVVPLSLILSDVQTDLKSFSLVLNEKDPLVLRRTLQVTRLAPSMTDRFGSKMERASEIARVAPFDSLVGSQMESIADTPVRVEQLAADIEAFARASESFTSKVLESQESPDDESIVQMQRDLRDRARRLDERLNVLRSDLRGATDLALARATEQERQSLWALTAASGGALVIAVLLLLVVLVTIRPLAALSEAAKRIGLGDYRPIDVPEPKLGRDEIATLTEEFNSMANSLADRDAELREQHDKLLKSERLAAIGRMTSLITHELRNPLSSINLNAEMLQDALTEESPDAAETTALLGTIIDEVDRLRDITEEYLVYARLPSPDMTEQNLGDLVQSLVDFHMWEWGQLDIQVEVDLPDSPVVLPFDANQMRQAVLNLVKNAVEASPAGSTVVVSVRDSDAFATLEVTDEGEGIEPADLEHLFEPFFTTKKSGTGLGLAMTQQIVEEHRGRIEVESDAGGTRFRLQIPHADS
jgi:signal transduction histidine kinase